MIFMKRLIPQPLSAEYKNGCCNDGEKITCFKKQYGSEEAYTLSVEKDGIKIEAQSPAGEFYAEKTLEQFKILYGDTLPCVTIEDKPYFSYRGFMLDSARHFISVAEIKKIVDTASRFKLNRFHWHLSDDQGFRIQLDGFPELTEKGSVRPGDTYRNLPKTDKPYGGFYTKDEIREIVAYCRERFIEVIPEIDVPGHVSAILYTYPQYHCGKKPVDIKTKEGIFEGIFCAGNEETYRFIFALLDEITELFPYEYFHLGGDEAPKKHWKACPDCQKKMKELGLTDENDLQVYFGNRIADYLKSKGKKVVMWNDILKGKGLSKDVTVQRWMDIKNLSAPETNSGRQTIASDFRPYYCDYPYEMFPLKNVYKFDPLAKKGLTDAGKKNVIGIESPIWLEFINTDERLEYLIFPRWFAVADTAWGYGRKTDYADFAESCEVFCRALKKEGCSAAPSKNRDPNVLKRLFGTAGFFIPKNG